MKKTKFLESAISELQFANLQTAYLKSVLDELETFAGTLEKAVIKNAKERYEIDKLIHAKLIFK